MGRDREGAIAVLASGHNCCKAASACVTLLFTTALGQALHTACVVCPVARYHSLTFMSWSRAAGEVGSLRPGSAGDVNACYVRQGLQNWYACVQLPYSDECCGRTQAAAHRRAAVIVLYMLLELVMLAAQNTSFGLQGVHASQLNVRLPLSLIWYRATAAHQPICDMQCQTIPHDAEHRMRTDAPGSGSPFLCVIRSASMTRIHHQLRG